MARPVRVPGGAFDEAHDAGVGAFARCCCDAAPDRVGEDSYGESSLTRSLDEARFESIVAALRETTEGPKVVDPVEASKVLADSYDLTKDEGRSVLLRLAQGGDLSRWGMVNAVTAAAKDADTFERQAEMELVGGALVAATPREWAKVATATSA